MGLNPMLLLHLAYSEEGLKFKAEIPPFPEAPNHKSQCAPIYHQGDINVAWQTGGSGVKDSTRKAVFKMGINVVNYSFNQYLSLHFGS